uniref:Uncharacterized protein n=1 Tax=Glossina pallidipes TaxID=7398 RepID=A0A1A9ZGG9_GLOPL
MHDQTKFIEIDPSTSHFKQPINSYNGSIRPYVSTINPRVVATAEYSYNPTVNEPINTNNTTVNEPINTTIYIPERGAMRTTLLHTAAGDNRSCTAIVLQRARNCNAEERESLAVISTILQTKADQTGLSFGKTRLVAKRVIEDYTVNATISTHGGC